MTTPNYWGPGSGSSGFFTGSDSLTSSPFDNNYWSGVEAKYGKTQQNQGNIARVGNDGIAYVSGSTTRYSGKDPVSGKMYKDGVLQTLVPGSSTEYINPNDPNQRYDAVSIAKNPALNDVIKTQTDQLAKTVTDNVKSWNDLLPKYNLAGDQAVASSKVAADTSGAQKTLQDAQNRFSTGLDTAQGDYASLDAANAAKQRDIVARRYADEAAYNDLQDQARGVSLAGVERMTNKNGAVRGGIPFGTDAQAAFARQSYEASLPYQLAKENYHQQNLANESGVETALTADEARRIGFNVSAQGQQYQSSQGTAQAIQALRVAGASQDQETVKRILQNPQMLQEAVRQSAMGDTQLANLLTQAMGANNYQALRDKLGVQVSQPIYFSSGQTGGYPGPQTPTGNGGGAPNYFNPNGTTTGTGGIPAANGNGGIPYTPIPSGTGPALAGYRNQPAGNVSTGAGGGYYNYGNTPQQGYRVNPQTGQLEDANGNWWSNPNDRGNDYGGELSI